MLNLISLADKTWVIISPFLTDVTHIAQAFFTFIFALVLIGEALSIAQGKGIQLGSKLLTFVFVGIFVMGWSPIANAVRSDAKNSFLSPISADLEIFSTAVVKHVVDIDRANMVNMMAYGPMIGGVKSLLSGDMFTGILFKIMGLVNLVACAFCNVYILTYFVCFEIVLIFAPLFIIFAISSETRSIFIGYITNVISYLVAFFCFMIMVKVINLLNDIRIDELLNQGSGQNWGHIVPYLLQVIFVFTIIGGVGKITAGMTKSSIGGK